MDIRFFKAMNGRVLEIVDRRGIHREAVVVSLDREGPGRAVIQANKLEVVGPEHDDLDEFEAALEAWLDELDVASLPRAD